MISNHAHNQNLASKKMFEGLGYKFSIGADGWAIWYNDNDIAAGPTQFAKGEDAYRQSLDAAIGRALLYHKQHVNVIRPEIRLDPKPNPKPALSPQASAALKKSINAAKATTTPPPAPPAPEISPIHRKAFATALGFLKVCGAVYTLEFDGQVHTNVVKKKQQQVNNFKPHYFPLLDAHKDEDQFSLEWTVPAEFDFKLYAVALRNYMQSAYGVGNYVTTTTSKTRTISVVVVRIKEPA